MTPVPTDKAVEAALNAFADEGERLVLAGRPMIEVTDARCRMRAALIAASTASAEAGEPVDEGLLSQMKVSPGDMLERLSGHDQYSERYVGDTYEVVQGPLGLCLQCRSNSGWTTMADKGRFRRIVAALSPSLPPPDQAMAERVERLEAALRPFADGSIDVSGTAVILDSVEAMSKAMKSARAALKAPSVTGGVE